MQGHHTQTAGDGLTEWSKSPHHCIGRSDYAIIEPCSGSKHTIRADLCVAGVGKHYR